MRVKPSKEYPTSREFLDRLGVTIKEALSGIAPKTHITIIHEDPVVPRREPVKTGLGTSFDRVLQSVTPKHLAQVPGFTPQPDDEVLDQAFSEGFDAARRGLPRHNSYPVEIGRDRHKAWLQGYDSYAESLGLDAGSVISDPSTQPPIDDGLSPPSAMEI